MRLSGLLAVGLGALQVIARNIQHRHNPHIPRDYPEYHDNNARQISASAVVQIARTSTTRASSTTTRTGVTTSASTTLATTSTTSTMRSTTSTAPIIAASAIIDSTILIIAKDDSTAAQISNGLNAYGIPFQTLVVPQAGITLPALNTSSGGNFGGMVIVGKVAYDYGASGWGSALTTDQWSQLYAYQSTYGIRMVQIDVYPTSEYGVSVVGSCCDSGVDQTIYFTNTTGFATAGLKTGSSAGISTSGLYHYMAQIADKKTTWEIAQFGTNSQYTTPGTAAVINNFNGRQQMVFFISWATAWSPASNFLQHAWIHWITRGVYAGYRRINFSTQIDDVMLRTQIYYPDNSTTFYRITPDDLRIIQRWYPTIQAKMNKGSYYRVELGHNGNGNIIWANNSKVCSGGPIYTKYDSTSLEFQKPLGTGVDGWPQNVTKYPYAYNCLTKDPFAVWVFANKGSFMHISHTFTHEGQNNATYNDIYKEINWNQQWFRQIGLYGGIDNFTPDGIIPPAITGTHNGDALRAWADNGITHCVGDNSRPLLRNQQNPMWPYMTTMANNGYDGMMIIPRWDLRIYYDCDSPACTTQEWTDRAGGDGNFASLMAREKSDTTRNLLGLYHDPYMFHQLNLRSAGMPTTTTPFGTQVKSLMQAWVEQTVYEFTRLVNWPMITLRQTDLAKSFKDRMARDACKPNLKWTTQAGRIIGVTVGAVDLSCSAPIPITLPVNVAALQGLTTEQIGNDPLTVWVKLKGSPISLDLSSAVSML